MTENDTLRQEGVHPIQREVTTIIITPENYAYGVTYTVGRNGITKIEQTFKNGEYAHIPYLRVWRGDRPIAEFCQHKIIAVLFENNN